MLLAFFFTYGINLKLFFWVGVYRFGTGAVIWRWAGCPIIQKNTLYYTGYESYLWRLILVQFERNDEAGVAGADGCSVCRNVLLNGINYVAVALWKMW